TEGDGQAMAHAMKTGAANLWIAAALRAPPRPSSPGRNRAFGSTASGCNRWLAVAISVVLPILAADGAAADPTPQFRQLPLIPRLLSRPGSNEGPEWDRVIVIAAGSVIGVIGANYLTGGMITPLITFGAVGAPPGAAASAGTTAVLVFIATEA